MAPLGTLRTRLARLIAPRAAVMTTAELAELLRGRDGYDTASGAFVTEASAMQASAVYACVKVIAEDVGKLPLHLYRRLDRGKERVTDHWLADLLDTQPNPWQTPLEFREMMQAHTLLRGNGYAIKTVVRGEVRELLPVPPDRVQVEQLRSRALVYHVDMEDGTRLPVPDTRMFHLRGLSLDGVCGLSPIGYQREAIGLALSLTRHGARLFRQGAQLGGVLEYDGKLDDDSYNRLKDSFDTNYAGVDNAHKTAILEYGIKYNKIGMTSEDAQFLESRKFSRSEIASLFRVPPHKIGDLEKATFSNIEQQSIEYVTDCLLSWLTRWEQRIALSLLPEAERRALFVQFLVNALLRGDFVARTTGYTTGIMSGWLSRNDVREMENLNPRPGLDEYLQPLNMVPAGTVPTEAAA